MDAGQDAGAPEWVLEPTGIAAAQLGVLVNQNDPLSVAVAAHFVQARQIPAGNVVNLAFPTGAVMAVSDFTMAKAAVDAQLDGGIQALVLTWTQPYRVDCQSAVSAFALGYDAGAYCSTQGAPCSGTAAVPTYDSLSHQPYTDFGIRPTMMIAARDAGSAAALIDKGVSADGTFPAGVGWFVRTNDTARSVRYPDFQYLVQTWADGGALDLRYQEYDGGAQTNEVDNQTDVLFYLTGLASVPNLATNTYLPGAVADHLTSFGGQVPTSGQMSALAWLEAGATASYGTVVEPCNYTQKFPRASVLVAHYYRGEPIIEAYWKSVSMVGEGNFVGEPLAAPFGTQVTSYDAASGTLSLTTTSLVPNHNYTVESAPARSGPWTLVQANVSIARAQRFTVTVQPATQPFYRLRY